MRHSAALSVLVMAFGAALAAPSSARPVAPASRPRQRSDAGVQPPSQMCRARLVVRQTEGASGCFIDERVTGAPGELRYPCGGGAATATFRNGVFAGTVGANGEVSLSLRTRFHYGDGCDWATVQNLRGALTSGVRFEYTEAPVPGQRGCARACHATGDVEVQRVSAQ